MLTKLTAMLPTGATLDDAAWRRRHRLIEVVLALHVPAFVVLGVVLGRAPLEILLATLPPALLLLVERVVPTRRVASSLVAAGLSYCSIALVWLTGGSIEAHFHFFVIVGLLALYQDWVPLLWNVVFTVLSHGIGATFYPNQIFSHPAAQASPWTWALIHGGALLVASVGGIVFARVTEDEQVARQRLGRELAEVDVENGRRQFTSDLLVNLARRNQAMLYRQLDIINQLEEKEEDPDALAELFTLDHLATRVRRNAESLLVLSGEQPPRIWAAPVSIRDVVRAAIAETEDLERVEFSVDARVAVAGHCVADLTHLLAELTENAVRFSPPDTPVTIHSRPNRVDGGGQVLTVEDWGVSMPEIELVAANELLLRPQDVDLSVAQRLGFHVVARLAARHGIEVSLSATPGSGLTAVVLLPAALFVSDPQSGPHGGIGSGPERTRRADAVHEVRAEAERGALGVELPGIAAAAAWTPPTDRPAAAAAVWTPPPADRPRTAPPSQQPASRPAAPGANWSGWWDPAPVDRQAAPSAAPAPVWSTASPPAGSRGVNGHHRPSPVATDRGRNGQDPGVRGPAPQESGERPALAPGGPEPAAAMGGLPAVDHPRGPHTTGRTGDGVVPEAPATTPVPDASGPPRSARDDRTHDDRTHDDRTHDDRTHDDRTHDDRTHDDGRTGPDPTIPHPRRESSAEPATTGSSGLRRRVPQASLAPELRSAARSGSSPATDPVAGAEAARALSRYQSSRQAAQADAEKHQDGELRNGTPLPADADNDRSAAP
ncbi:ATP-binding protein [Pseudonocardia sp. WMMC193]|uniref:ATP-binding protein n=1 Tax=Pseudonocardia sp. WMMC193 TaxID=2911965 RepID=UPI001F3A76F2|nr:ATP-binding protein [Pseudonocardia sp. WMMC193]MCF7553267.1 ATP-binding protein [Pseudonocardia sp. WMMC193]